MLGKSKRGLVLFKPVIWYVKFVRFVPVLILMLMFKFIRRFGVSASLILALASSVFIDMLIRAVGVELVLGLGLILIHAGVGVSRQGSRRRKEVFAMTNTFRKLDRGQVKAALDSIGCELGGCRISQISETSQGWKVAIQLPRGYVARLLPPEKWAAALGRVESSIRVKTCSQTLAANQLELNVLKVRLDQVVQSRPKLLDLGDWDIFQKLPIAEYQGEVVEIPIAGKSAILGGIPGAGKSVTMLDLILGISSDPTSEILVCNFGGGGYGAVKPLLSHYSLKDENRAMSIIRAFQAESIRREKILDENDLSKFEKSDLERFGVRPMWLMLDEVQELFASELGDEAKSELISLVKRGRKCLMHVFLATQDPNNESLPSSISRVIPLKWCGEQDGYLGTNATLGTNAWESGARPMWGVPGMGYWRGVGGGLKQARTYELSDDEMKMMVERILETKVVKEFGVERVVEQGVANTKSIEMNTFERVERVVKDLGRNCALKEIGGLLGGEFGRMDSRELGEALRGAGVPVQKVKVKGEAAVGVNAKALAKVADNKRQAEISELLEGDQNVA